MKASLSLLLLALIATNVHAGLPSDDYTVDLTRESFRDGTLPSPSDLLLDHQWVCGSYDTQEGTHTGSPGVILNQVFFTQGNGIINRTMYFPGKIPLASEGNQLESHAISEVNPGQLLFNYAIRKNHGGLLVELAVPTQNATPLVPSIAFEGMRATGYLYCIAFDANSGVKKIMNRQWGDLYSN